VGVEIALLIVKNFNTKKEAYDFLEYKHSIVVDARIV
tara:strand:- start:4492 stop:4602 length:111 start_codon:yes stop_codon:yes gene_type:complete